MPPAFAAVGRSSPSSHGGAAHLPSPLAHPRLARAKASAARGPSMATAPGRAKARPASSEAWSKGPPSSLLSWTRAAPTRAWSALRLLPAGEAIACAADPWNQMPPSPCPALIRNPAPAGSSSEDDAPTRAQARPSPDRQRVRPRKRGPYSARTTAQSGAPPPRSASWIDGSTGLPPCWPERPAQSPRIPGTAEPEGGAPPTSSIPSRPNDPRPSPLGPVTKSAPRALSWRAPQPLPARSSPAANHAARARSALRRAK
ncbi:MAG: hypothetical protein RL685_50 [Pseudomonadota bacterium]|jgi:hypothetical protein